MAVPGNVIVLNQDTGFLSINHWYDAFCLVYNEKADVKATYDQEIRSANQSFPAPAVIQLRHQIKMGRRRQPFTLPSHRTIWVRDEGPCAYCAKPISLRAVTKDHVVPKCKGGLDTLTNVVASCGGCNSKKGDKRLAESGLKLRDGVELRTLTDDEKLTVLIKTCQSHERKTWMGFLRREGLTLF